MYQSRREVVKYYGLLHAESQILYGDLSCECVVMGAVFPSDILNAGLSMPFILRVSAIIGTLDLFKTKLIEMGNIPIQSTGAQILTHVPVQSHTRQAYLHGYLSDNSPSLNTVTEIVVSLINANRFVQEDNPGLAILSNTWSMRTFTACTTNAD